MRDVASLHNRGFLGPILSYNLIWLDNRKYLGKKYFFIWVNNKKLLINPIYIYMEQGSKEKSMIKNYFETYCRIVTGDH